ncbi:DUF2975 domain-containing protein [Planococcus faecalis]|uniref:DUF2975 domain-containing protein n=1 Tax=Planococcus faecalis TaxID=1598147 RepID=A0ABM6IVX4_9BACL|nr:DUF2975 domain-containing protein [Planococcus faecalis]AQU80716.1 hypothetical protein AJGP001_16105 [Planococcus faecalis]OHX55709.1 hypothetical protein BB777_00675 [Planococcus faecalis]
MERKSTIFLRLTVILMGIPILSFCIFGVFWLANNPANPVYASMLYPIVSGIYLSVIPFFIALYQTLKLLTYIDKDQTFSKLPIASLRKIKLCAITISGLYVVILPFVFRVADLDDAPGLILVGMLPAFASMVVAVFAAVLQRLLQVAIDLKSENDLMV